MKARKKNKIKPQVSESSIVYIMQATWHQKYSEGKSKIKTRKQLATHAQTSLAHLAPSHEICYQLSLHFHPFNEDLHKNSGQLTTDENLKAQRSKEPTILYIIKHSAYAYECALHRQAFLL